MYHVVFSTNTSFHVMYLAVAVRSLVGCCSKASELSVHILWSQLSACDLERLERSWSDLDFHYEFHQIDHLIEPIRGQDNHGFWNYFWLDRVLPKSAQRAVYLDCDVVCSRDICELWEVDLGSCVVGAVPDPLNVLESMAGTLSRNAHLVDLEFGTEDTYVNTGLVLIDLSKWREEDVANTVAQSFFGRFGDLPLWDQDSLNLLLRGRILALPPCWNLIEYARLYDQWPYEIYQGSPKDYFSRKIRHFSGERKPDRPWVRLSDKREFYSWLDQTDWKGWRSDWDRGLPSIVFSRFLEMHYLVCRGFQHKTIAEPVRKMAELVVQAPYVVPLYLILPLYRAVLRVTRRVRASFG
jgi:lipopolysaccharide biosynthesis glycosyltransferase